EIIAHHADAQFERLSAISAGVKEIRAEVEKAKALLANAKRKNILFVDEVHRFNKAQQDALLPYVEDGTFILIGATTENPSFELNRALLSRTRVYVLKSLTADELMQVLKAALTDKERGLGKLSLKFPDELKQILI